MPDRDIVDAIDELVDWQLSNYENRSGYDRNVNQVDCPHSWCREPWHGLAITRRMQEMRWGGQVDPAYRYADDTSEVLCPGSEFDGEFTPPEQPDWSHTKPPTVNEMLLAAWSLYGDLLEIPDITGLGYDDGRPLTAAVVNSRHRIIDMAEVDSLRGLRCQVGIDNAAHAEYLRERVRCSFFEAVARRYTDVEIDPAEIHIEHRQEPIGSLLVAWWEPDPVGGVLEGGHAHGREVDANVGHRVETVAPARMALDFSNSHATHPPAIPDLNIVTYERAAYDTVTRRWVYRPRQPRLTFPPGAPTVRLWREDPDPQGSGWQELGTVAGPIVVTETDLVDHPPIRLDHLRRDNVTVTLTDINPDAARLLFGDDNPAAEPAEGDQAA